MADLRFYVFLARLDEVQEELYCTSPGVGVGVGGGGGSKKFNVKVFLYDGQGTVRRAILSPELILWCGIAGFTHNLLLWPQISNCLHRQLRKTTKIGTLRFFLCVLGFL